MSLVKICGLKRSCDIEYVNKYKPDFIGFILSPCFKRSITPIQAQHLKNHLDKDIKAIGVFVNEDPGYILNFCEKDIIDIVQLHGDEDEIYITKLKEKTNKPVIKAVRVKSQEDILSAQNLPCDYLLLDAYQKGAYGGIGETFNWNMIPENINKPFFLAGGLDGKNVEQAIKQINPYAVDLSSGAETNGVKDETKIKTIIENVRRIK